MKNRFNKLFAVLKEFKYEILMTFEIVALVIAATYYAFGRKKHFSFLTAFSTLLGAYISTSALFKMNSKIKSRKFVDIISISNKESGLFEEEAEEKADEEDDEIVFELEDDGIIEDND